ncbi:MAG: DUF1499 domain-containing protein [Phormidesmis sp.]
MKSISLTLLKAALTVALVVLIGLSGPASALAQTNVAVLPGLKGVFAGSQPADLGVKDGLLTGCPPSPNCVVSQGADEDHAIAPIRYSTDRATAQQNLVDILGVVPRTQVIQQQDGYILAESESRLMGFVDDSEFYFPAAEKVIQLRAAARLGESDLGVNRRRLEQIRLALEDLEQRAAVRL